MQKKTHKLDGNYELPFSLIAISSSDSLLKMAWNLNNSLGINLHESEFQIPSKENPTLYFPVLSDKKTSPTVFYSLIPNKQPSTLLVKELPNIDFIFEISGDINKNETNTIIKKIKQVPGIIAVLEVAPEKIKRKNAFLPL